MLDGANRDTEETDRDTEEIDGDTEQSWEGNPVNTELAYVYFLYALYTLIQKGRRQKTSLP